MLSYIFNTELTDRNTHCCAAQPSNLTTRAHCDSCEHELEKQLLYKTTTAEKSRLDYHPGKVGHCAEAHCDGAQTKFSLPVNCFFFWGNLLENFNNNMILRKFYIISLRAWPCLNGNLEATQYINAQTVGGGGGQKGPDLLHSFMSCRAKAHTAEMKPSPIHLSGLFSLAIIFTVTIQQ